MLPANKAVSLYSVAHAFPNDDTDKLNTEDYMMLTLLTDGVLSDDELLVFFAIDTLCTSEQKSEHKKYNRFDIDTIGPLEFRKFFHFEKKDIPDLCHLLKILDRMYGSTRVTWTSVEGLCILLRRLAYPNHLCDLIPQFGRSKSELSEIVNAMLEFLCDTHKDKLSSIRHHWDDHAKYCQAILDKGAALSNVFGFIDGMTDCVCRPSHGQEELFSGHKRCHVVKYQHVMLPNGIIAHCFGPFPGRRNDAGMYRDSGIDAELQAITLNGQQLALFGDGGYANRPWLVTPFRGQLGPEQLAFNQMMSAVRISVEWGFAKVKTLFAFLNFYPNQKLFLQPIGDYFNVATLLANCHTCLYGSEISQYFGIDPPNLQQYLL